MYIWGNEEPAGEVNMTMTNNEMNLSDCDKVMSPYLGPPREYRVTRNVDFGRTLNHRARWQVGGSPRRIKVSLLCKIIILVSAAPSDLSFNLAPHVTPRKSRSSVGRAYDR